MSDRKPSLIGFKSRFSILSLLPARHPPLDPNPPSLPSLSSRDHVLPPTRTVASRHPTVVSLNDYDVSPVQSEYPIDVYSPPILPPVVPVPAVRRSRKRDSDVIESPFSIWNQSSSSVSSGPDKVESSSRSKRSPHRRPPPLDLRRTKEVYPGVVGVIPTAGTLIPSPVSSSPKTALALRKKAAKGNKVQKQERVRIQDDDPFDVVELESAHQYPSWRGGRVSITPGQVIPDGMLGDTSTIRGVDPSTIALPPRSKSRTTRADRSHLSPEVDSVLHDVVLTPTYLGLSRSPAVPATPSPVSPTDARWSSMSGGSRPYKPSRHKTLLETIKRGSRMLMEPKTERSLRGLREQEAQEMARFRLATRPARIAEESTGFSSHSPNLHPNAHAYPRQSPGAREWNIGLGVSVGTVDGKKNKGDDGKMWKAAKDKEEKLQRQRMWKVRWFISTVQSCHLIAVAHSARDRSARCSGHWSLHFPAHSRVQQKQILRCGVNRHEWNCRFGWTLSGPRLVYFALTLSEPIERAIQDTGHLPRAVHDLCAHLATHIPLFGLRPTPDIHHE